FNGDGSEDLAVLVKPNEAQLSDINSELANWILEDPKNATPSRTRPGTPPPRAHVEKNETLLAVVHGVGSVGWRNPEAKQTYLLKDAGAANISAQTFKSLQAVPEKQKLPELRGDVISETLNGLSGMVYWNGGKYIWFPTGAK
ncbi:MAG TPA: hypothetical protein VGU64_10315, partial [Terriglobales bacterium]|nr:hypothetical protein [Terriglobales bacterium]